MKFTLQLTAVVFLVASTASFATGSWSGYLVDSKCYETRLRNVNPWSPSTVTRDMDLVIEYCAPKAKTKSLGLVQKDWTMFKFDPAGNARAAEFVKNTAKQKVYPVTIVGNMDGRILKLESVSMAKYAASTLKAICIGAESGCFDFDGSTHSARISPEKRAYR
ncbi:MAG TPA: hypothetical protein VGI34_00875 [Candidatus Acidoferrales bacterium]|jgi:hypothetical protein